MHAEPENEIPVTEGGGGGGKKGKNPKELKIRILTQRRNETTTNRGRIPKGRNATEFTLSGLNLIKKGKEEEEIKPHSILGVYRKGRRNESA